MKQRILIALAALMQFSFLFSEETNTENVQTEKLSLERVIEQALNTNSTIKESEIELTQSKRNYAHSWNNFLPSVTASATASEAGDFESSASGAATGTITTNATASLSLNASLAKKIQALKESYKSGERSYENTIREIRKGE